MTVRLTAASAIAVLLLAGVSCDKHSWEETRVLHGHGHHEHEHHHEDGKHKDAKTDASHGEEKKAAH